MVGSKKKERKLHFFLRTRSPFGHIHFSPANHSSEEYLLVTSLDNILTCYEGKSATHPIKWWLRQTASPFSPSRNLLNRFTFTSSQLQMELVSRGRSMAIRISPVKRIPFNPVFHSASHQHYPGAIHRNRCTNPSSTKRTMVFSESCASLLQICILSSSLKYTPYSNSTQVL